jgi:hypothetical protein
MRRVILSDRGVGIDVSGEKGEEKRRLKRLVFVVSCNTKLSPLRLSFCWCTLRDDVLTAICENLEGFARRYRLVPQ